MDAEFWDPNETDMEFMGNLKPESDDDVSALIFEQLGMVDRRPKSDANWYRIEGMPDEGTAGLPKE